VEDMDKIIPMSSFNDDFCDCFLSANDEPGTSACPNGSFFCQDPVVQPFSLSAMMVNDGICDCCDGSDEYLNITRCENRCLHELKASIHSEMDELRTFFIVILRDLDLGCEGDERAERSCP